METIAKFEIGKTYGQAYTCVKRSDKFAEFQIGGHGLSVRYKIREENGNEFITFTKHNGPRSTYQKRVWANPID